MSHIEIRTPASIMRAQARDDLAAAQRLNRQSLGYLIVSVAALLVACALVAWAIWA